jgi:succinate dehydrogenase/fumarate reductase cytochrome b subunit
MGRFNRLWHMPKLCPWPTIIYVVVIFLVVYHILEGVPLTLWLWSLLPNTAEYLDHD